MHFFSVPYTIQRLIPSCTWRKEGSEKMVYLTFDDGPHPSITPWVVELLEKYKAKATFFCVGENIQKYPEVCAKLLMEGHAIGNHTMHHVKGWKTSLNRYLSDVNDCQSLIQTLKGNENMSEPTKHHPTKLFRPPYGQIRPSQIRSLKNQGYNIIQWSLLSCDYDPNLNINRSLSALKKGTEAGSIVVFHDSEKAEKQLKQLLPQYLEHLNSEGYLFNILA
jgi:peptidoglycan/xylan/chitin deacetylase (PgdA/CDA1 family)